FPRGNFGLGENAGRREPPLKRARGRPTSPHHPPRPSDDLQSHGSHADCRRACRFCGEAKAPLVQTPCGQQWIGCDTALVSFRGGGRCQVEPERVSLGSSHYEDQPGGPWESCQKGRDFWTPREDKT